MPQSDNFLSSAPWQFYRPAINLSDLAILFRVCEAGQAYSFCGSRAWKESFGHNHPIKLLILA